MSYNLHLLTWTVAVLMPSEVTTEKASADKYVSISKEIPLARLEVGLEKKPKRTKTREKFLQSLISSRDGPDKSTGTRQT